MRSIQMCGDVRILIGFLLLGPVMAAGQQTPTPAAAAPTAPAAAASPAASATPSPSPMEDDEPEPQGGPPGLSEARKAIREGKVEEGLAKLKTLRDGGDKRPSVHYWTGIGYQKLGLLELAWRELHQAVLYQPSNRNYLTNLRSVERDLQSPPATPEVAPTPSANLPALLPAEDPDGLRLRAERALRQNRPRLAAGLAQRLLETRPEDTEVLLLGTDAALRDGAALSARALFDRHPQAKAAELEGLRDQLEALEQAQAAPKLEGSSLEQGRTALDQLLLAKAMELLGKARVEVPQDVEVLRLLASVHALRGDEQVAKAFIAEATFDDPSLQRYLERIDLLEASPVRAAHQTVLEPGRGPVSAATPAPAP